MERDGVGWVGSRSNRNKKFGLPVGHNYLVTSVPCECSKLKIGSWWEKIAQDNPQPKKSGNCDFDQILTVHVYVFVISCLHRLPSNYIWLT